MAMAKEDWACKVEKRHRVNEWEDMEFVKVMAADMAVMVAEM